MQLGTHYQTRKTIKRRKTKNAHNKASITRNKQDFRSFLGIFIVYRRFVHGYKNISSQIIELLRLEAPKVKAELTDKQAGAFQTLIKEVN